MSGSLYTQWVLNTDFQVFIIYLIVFLCIQRKLSAPLYSHRVFASECLQITVTQEAQGWILQGVPKLSWYLDDFARIFSQSPSFFLPLPAPCFLLLIPLYYSIIFSCSSVLNWTLSCSNPPVPGFSAPAHRETPEDCRSCLECSDDNGCVRCPERLFLFLQRDGMSHHGTCLHACPTGHYGQRGKDINRCMSMCGQLWCQTQRTIC